jgi:hypothetical protein
MCATRVYNKRCLLTVSRVAYVSGVAFPSSVLYYCGVNIGCICFSDRFVHKNILYHLAISEFLYVTSSFMIFWQINRFTNFFSFDPNQISHGSACPDNDIVILIIVSVSKGFYCYTLKIHRIYKHRVQSLDLYPYIDCYKLAPKIYATLNTKIYCRLHITW